MKLLSLFLLGLVVSAQEYCQESQCSGNCRCMSTSSPGGLPVERTPQLVMLTFDDAVNPANYQTTYRPLFTGKYKNPSQCMIGATFFVSHEYNNYAELHHLYRSGSEIAVHSITHLANTEIWKKAPAARWKRESSGMRNYISQFGQIPKEAIQGFRAPFLQTAGNVTFQTLKDEGFTYDSSLATRRHAGLSDTEQPIWPFTLDNGFYMDCVIQPCPNMPFAGFWEVPLVSFFRMREMIDGEPPVMMPCAMADACPPWPETEEDTYNYFMDNFNRHYLKNRAPLPVFLHESWLKHDERKAGYLKFFHELLSMQDVFIVTVQEVLEYIRNPKPLEEYKEKRCVTQRASAKCQDIGTYCNYDKTPLGGPRALFVCGVPCPQAYPWINT